MNTASSEKIRVLIVDDNFDTRENLKKMLYFEHDMEVVGAAGGGNEGVQKAKDLRPHIVLMDINMPDIDGIRATERVRAEAPASAVIIMSVQGEQEYMRRAMMAGSSDYLVKPFSTDELVGSIRSVYQREAHRYRVTAPPPVPGPATTLPTPGAAPEQGRVVAVFSPKGGVGTTTIAVNLACALSQSTKKRVVLLDCSLLFGDVAVMLNLVTKMSLADLAPHSGELDAELIRDVVVDHASGIKVLLAPPRPEIAELVTAEQITAILAKLRALFDFIVIDTLHSFQEVMLAILDAADKIIAVTTPEVTALKNIKLFLETIEALGYPTAKLLLVVNRVDSHGSIGIDEIEANVNQKVACGIVNDWKLATFAINHGVPFIMSSRESQISKDILSLANLVAEGLGAKSPQEEQTKGKGIGGRLGLFRR